MKATKRWLRVNSLWQRLNQVVFLDLIKPSIATKVGCLLCPNQCVVYFLMCFLAVEKSVP